jgi:hypothetical protein
VNGVRLSFNTTEKPFQNIRRTGRVLTAYFDVKIENMAVLIYKL